MNSMDPGFANRILFVNSWKASVIIYTNASPAMVIFTQSSNLDTMGSDTNEELIYLLFF